MTTTKYNELIESVLKGETRPNCAFLTALHKRARQDVNTKGLIPYPEVEQAIITATFLHHDQFLWGTRTPYVSHVLSVGELVASCVPNDPEVWIASILLGSVHEAGFSIEQVDQQFGLYPANLVEYVTEDSSLPTWQQRKEGYLERFADAPQNALIICAAENLQCLETISAEYRSYGFMLWRHFDVTPERLGWFFGSVTELIKNRLDSPIVEILTECWSTVQPLFSDKCSFQKYMYCNDVTVSDRKQIMLGLDFLNTVDLGIFYNLYAPERETLRKIKDQLMTQHQNEYVLLNADGWSIHHTLDDARAEEEKEYHNDISKIVPITESNIADMLADFSQ